MEMLTAKIPPLYRKYWAATFGSSMVTCIYSMVDVAMVGQYHGPIGAAALAVVAPLWNILFSLGLLTGIGGAILFSNARGSGKDREVNEYFSISLLMTVVLSALSWIGVAFFAEELMILFGADAETLPYTIAYLKWVKYVVPAYLLNQTLAAYLRNDNAPTLATIGILAGGIFNVFGDYFFVFTLDMGIEGAGLATATGALISTLVLGSHFLTKKNTLKLTKISAAFFKFRQVIVNGFSTFFIDIAMGILTMLFNRQIMAYLGQDALAVYSILIQISTFVQCCAYSVGESAQPIMSVNGGAAKYGRVLETIRCAVKYAIVFGVLWLAIIFAFPNIIVRLFMQPTEEVLAIAPFIMRSYGISFLFLPVNIASTFLFQSLMKSNISFVISVGRGMVISGLCILLLPLVLPANSIWYAMVITEIVVCVYVVTMLRRCTKELHQMRSQAACC